MEPTQTGPGGRQQTHPTPDLAYQAVMLLGAAAAFCDRMGIHASIGLYDLPRDAFDGIEDFESGLFPGYVLAPDPKNPMWWKRAPGRIHVYTREPPKSGDREA